ncbi:MULTISPECIES: 4Fe-4S dicluster domain-containing protein [unclassified Leeuwenhoekiella]|uniref:4Fe-4S binding protein n=1 Tax=unclassified Leeuwenhoekiella TaxID=2615029 RepID=UPI000C696EB0|nr:MULTISPECIES: 4Fe-4S dicluster domain-containing protein [unclassified Leeuwenhoekiella]MBA80469.1 FeS-binding protein [Leeuwenhoekiella sp.]|tara:strand:+ start:57772 stop:59361 length:1590 start_codon:yes stop_codon:yes gene_type:complete
MSTIQRDMSLTGQPPASINAIQKLGTALGVGGLLILLLATFNVNFPEKTLWLSIALSALFFGIVVFAYGAYADKQEGIKNDGVWFKSVSSRGFLAWVAGLALTGFYIVLYFKAGWLGLNTEGENTGLIALFDPLSKLLSGNPASQWFVYGTLYTIAILAFGIKFFWKYRHNRYEKLRTLSVMFFQTAFAFLIPEFMARLNSDEFNLPYYDLKNIWPLNYYNFEQYRVNDFISAGNVGLALLLFGIASIFVITPILTYKYGKRWYCSWVCGCGGLAETAGDSFRHLSDKSQFAWKVERWVVHSVLVFVVVMTTAVVSTYLGYDSDKYWLTKDVFLISVAVFLTLLFAGIWFFKKEELKQDARYGAIGYLVIVLALIGIHYASGSTLFLIPAETLRTSYGFLIGSIFSGVIGTGFYPIFGNRVWCRFGCPMAAILGLQQRLFSKFRITTNGGQCISCGNCSSYCEMGIDVRAYAQKGENIVRASCVGCGICSAVCPRGVLKLENGATNNRINSREVLLGNDVDLMDYVNQN